MGKLTVKELHYILHKLGKQGHVNDAFDIWYNGNYAYMMVGDTGYMANTDTLKETNNEMSKM